LTSTAIQADRQSCRKGGYEMEVSGGENDCTLVLTQRHGTNLIQLIYDKYTKGYYLHHRRRGKQILYEFVSDTLPDAQTAYHNYARDALTVFRE